jgi:L-asparaginase
MRFTTSAIGLLAGIISSSYSSPLPTPPHLTAPLLLPRALTTYNASLPNVTIFATGGTIAGSAGSNTQTTGYQAGALGIQVLIDAVPSILNVSNVNGVQVANVDSDNVSIV